MDRICNEALLRKVTTPRAAAAHIKNGMTVGFSGFTVIGYPKVLPAELARRAEEGEELGITVITGGNVGDQLDGVLARSGVMKRRYGFQGNRDLRALANADRIQYVDTHVSHGPYLIKNGYLGKIDVAVIEVAAIRADGSLVLPFSVGIDDTLVKYADKLILEVNEAIPLEVEGMHDILTLERAPHTQAIEIFKPDDRVGSPYLACDPDKVADGGYPSSPDSSGTRVIPIRATPPPATSCLIPWLLSGLRPGQGRRGHPHQLRGHQPGSPCPHPGYGGHCQPYCQIPTERGGGRPPA